MLEVEISEKDKTDEEIESIVKYQSRESGADEHPELWEE
jgi:hypothetical protein